MMKLKTVSDNYPFPLYYVGPDLDLPNVPTFFYFSISGPESLTLDPYNQPAALLFKKGYRILSVTLPGHHEGQDKHQAMEYWAHHLDELEVFLNQMHSLLDQLFDQKLINPEKFILGGLSRGGFVATHLLSHPKVLYAIGIAPLTKLTALSELKKHSISVPKSLQLNELFEKIYQKSIYYVIGNRDERVDTHAAFNFIYKLADYAYHKRVRSPNCEMRLFPSAGYLGHGSLPFVFEEAASWVEKQIES